MDWSDLGKTIAGYAPLLGGVVGGPAGGAIGSVIASAFGVENKPEDIAHAIKHDSKATVKLKEIELNNKVQLEQIAMDLARAEMADKQNARKENKHSVMPAVLCCFLTVSVVSFGAALMVVNIPEDNVRLIDTLFGAFLTAWLGSVTYWVGTTRSSANKDMK